MEEYRAILKRVGLVLIAVGLCDIIFMIYCVSQGQRYSSSFNIFAVIAGVFLLKGNLTAVRYVTFFTAFMLTGLIGLACIGPFVFPSGMWVAGMRFHPVALTASVLVGGGVIVLLAWVYQQLRRSPVLEARKFSGQSVGRPSTAFSAGVALVIIAMVTSYFTFRGSNGIKAVELARAKYGSGYSYFVTSIRWSGEHVAAQLHAYNDSEERSVEVKWDQ
jgi:hypothetical protein